ncbi:MAG: HNH endonuclease [Gemmatimonadetes bacterium]|nr:HNH endonuclease [Gemmatimonadota bacterium]
MKLQRPCLDCGRLTQPGHSRCEPCGTQVRRYWDRHSNARRRQRLQTGDGAAARLRRKITRDGSAICLACHRHLPASLIQVDHVLPLFLGGLDVDENLAPLCTPCHKTKTAKDAEKRRRKA